MQPDKFQKTLYVFFGLIASGKSTLAERFASHFQFPYYNTDRVRKELAGVDPEKKQPDQFNQGIYTREFSRRTYQEMLERAQEDFLQGSKGVVLDGSYNNRDERERVLKQATACEARCMFIHCICSEETVKERLALRAQDPHAVSDGRWEIYLVQKEKFQPPSELGTSRMMTVNTEQSVDQMVEKLATSMELQ